MRIIEIAEIHSQPELNTCPEQVVLCQIAKVPSLSCQIKALLVTGVFPCSWLLYRLYWQIMNLSIYDRRQQERYDKSHHRLRQVERELRRSEREEKRLEEKARENDLQERDRLKQRLEKVNQQNALADEKIAVSLCLLCLL